MTASTTEVIAPPPATRPLYAGGPEVSSIAWGMWRFSGDDVQAATGRVQAALDAGVTLFDTADIYGPDNDEPFGASEALFGRVFAADPGLKSKMTIATKGGIRMGWPYDSSAAYLASAIDASLTRLGVEHVALWQIHRPDVTTHPAEIARALETAHAAGKIGAVGVSNYTPSQVEALAAHLSLPIVSCQPEFSALHTAPMSDGVLDQAIARGMTTLAWSPLGGGRLALPREDRANRVAHALDAKAEDAGVSRAVVAYSWIQAHAAQPIPLVGSQTLSRIAEIADVAKVRWTRPEWYAVLAASIGPLP